MADNVMLATFVPIATIAWLTVIFLEAAGYGKTQTKSYVVTSCRFEDFKNSTYPMR
jgi:hypothetical protein